MSASAAVLLPTLQALENHVLQQLCAQDKLEPRYTPLYSRVLHRGNRPCGMFFCIHGPRLLRAYAVWSIEESRILFYEGTGQRFAETQVLEGPSLTEERPAEAG